MNEDPFTPLPRPERDARVVPITLALVLGTALTVTLFLMLQQVERHDLDEELNERAHLSAAVLERDLNEYLNALKSLNAFFYSSRDVDALEFRGFTREALDTLPSLVAVEWAPRIGLAQRPAHEAEARVHTQEPLPAYQILEPGPQDNHTPAGRRAEYLPRRFIEPPKERAALGLDLALDTNAAPARARALDLGLPSATPPFPLRDDTNVYTACRILVAIHTNLVTRDTPAARATNLAGYGVAVLNLTRFLQASLRAPASSHMLGLAWRVGDVTLDAGGGNRELTRSDSWIETLRTRRTNPGRRVLEDVAGRRWMLDVLPTTAYLAQRPRSHNWTVLAGGFLITGLFAAWLSLTLGRSVQVRRLVDQRTAELALANRELQASLAERERAEAALAAERGHIQALLDTSPDHIYFKDRDSRFIRINRSMATAFGLPGPEAAVGRSDADFFAPEHARQALLDEKEILRTGQSLIGREELETWPDGTTTWVSTTKQALRDRSGAIVGTFGVSRDITARKQAEQALARQAEALRRSNQDLEQFAYVASHDLQEPLRMVASYTQLLERRYQDKLDDEAREYIAFAVDGAVRMQALINDLLTYSRLDTQAKPFQPVDTAEAARRALANLKIAIDESQARISVGPLPVVMGELTQLTQLLQNLIGNAIKFRGAKPAVIHLNATLQVPPSPPGTPPGPVPPARAWVFSVRDEGIGIEPQYFNRIFAIFQRLHTREEYPGTGIGLAVCKKIVERHGGHIWLESSPGEGTTFFFTLPEAA